MDSLGWVISWVARGVVSAFLPSPERERVAAPVRVSPPRWSFFVGVIGFLVGLFLYVEGALAFMSGLVNLQGTALLQSGDPNVTDAVINWGGILSWFAWHLQPQAWLYMYVCLTGAVRVIAFAVTQEAVAEPVIWVPMRLLQNSRRKAEEQARLFELGPRRPDRAIEEDDCDLVVLSCREKEQWGESTTIEIGERQYRLIDFADRSDGRWKVIAYRLRESRPSDAVRSLVKTSIKPPEGHVGGALRAPEGRIWYFAFGLPMDPATSESVLTNPFRICTAQLSRHALRFAKPAAEDCGEAAAIPTQNPSDIVWGVVWECPERDADSLAQLEHIGDQCAWENLEVRDEEATRYAVQVAIVNEDIRDLSLLPTPEYRDRLLQAARTYPFSKIYLGLLRSSPTK